ncbi:MAG: hypothetical protein EBV34_20730 [Betaproteobacteria bacterium]|nr:hypothetical protein [Betaproteobacteria bacterium]NDC04374.1 hypothetical protein [Betaproteobacteria bacterium]
MATEQLFTVAGISKLPASHGGEYKIRFANDVMRVKVLMKGGHEDVRLAELDRPMTKMEAALALRDMAEFADVIAQATLAEFIDANTAKAPTVRAPKAVKPESTPTATKAPAEKKSAKSTAKSTYDEVKDMEDAPF